MGFRPLGFIGFGFQGQGFRVSVLRVLLQEPLAIRVGFFRSSRFNEETPTNQETTIQPENLGTHSTIQTAGSYFLQQVA